MEKKDTKIKDRPFTATTWSTMVQTLSSMVKTRVEYVLDSLKWVRTDQVYI